MKNCQISVAIATYNGAKYILGQLESIANQSFFPDEVVISDDCSTDDTVDLIRKFQKTAPFNIIISEQTRNIGILKNFYAVFAATSGEYIYYCDQDDVWLPDKIRSMQAVFAKDVVIVTSPSTIVRHDLTSTGQQLPFNRKLGLSTAPFDATDLRAFGHQLAFRRSVLDVMIKLKDVPPAVSGLSVGTNLDLYIPLCASMVGRSVILPNALTLFRRHEQASSGAGADHDRRITIVQRACRAVVGNNTSGSRLMIVKEAVLQHIGISAQVMTALRAKTDRETILAKLLALGRIGRIAAVPQMYWIVMRAKGVSRASRLKTAAYVTVAALG